MKHHHLAAACLICLLALSAAPAFAENPLPTFDKEAVRTYPFMRTGSPEIEVERQEVKPSEEYREGNTGTDEDPAFFVKSVKLTGYPVLDDKGELKAILAKYSGRSVKFTELDPLRNEIAAYCRKRGYTIPFAVIPKQEVKDGVLEVRVYVASYDDVEITVNSSDIYDKTLDRYISYLKHGDVITDRRLETAMNNLNDLPGVQARAILRPGSEPGTTKIDIEVQKRKVWNNYIYADNGGGYYSGRYRFGFNTEINNPTRTGDKIIVSGMLTDEDTDNYSVRYEMPVGARGTRLGFAYSKTSYDFTPNQLYDSLGESEGLSIYGLTPLYRSKSDRLTLIYGYDHRNITDEYRFRNEIFRPFNFSSDKEANVWHVGLSGSRYGIKQFLQYSLIYWYGDMSTDGGSDIDGGYHKLTADILKIWYDKRFNYRIRARGQLASRALDGSEQFFLGGINGVRAYANGDYYGDSGYTATGEIRYETGVPGLELAAFIDVGAVKNLATAHNDIDHLAGWGVGLRYSKPNDWYAQFDFARKINGLPDRDGGDDDFRLWFQVYKMF